MDKYPIIIDGEQTGEINIYPEGLHTVFEAACDARMEIVRLSVYGEGTEGYLGVMAPEGGRLHLKRRLTAADMRTFPGKIDYAGLSGRKPTPPKPPEAVPDAQAPAEEPTDEGLQEPSDDLLWFSTPEGVLTAFDGEKSLLAIPAEGRGGPKGIRKIINGREYAVFPGKGVHK